MKINLVTITPDAYTARATEAVAACIDWPFAAPPCSGTEIVVEGRRYLTGQLRFAIDPCAPADRVLVSCRVEVLK